jgi:membrane-associated phospholipid phosphatase
MVAAFRGGRALRLLVYLLLAIAAVTTVLQLLGINLDVAISSLFYDPTTHQFLSTPMLMRLRENGMIAIATFIGCLVLSVAYFLPWRLPSIPPRAAIFLTASLLIGPGLLVNGIMKPHWGRPRPIEITQFGGTLKFVNWWDPSGACDSNCSFISGEASTAAWMFGPAMLLPMPWRTVGIVAVAALTATISSLRVIAGGHFFTDVLFGALATILILLLLRRWIDPTKPR